MTGQYALLLDRNELICPLLGADERPHVERVLELCRGIANRARAHGKLVPELGDLDLKRELGRLTELLGRRASKALPAATLGRAALADLSGDLASFDASCADCHTKLLMLGF
jgi:hypothetical protein